MRDCCPIIELRQYTLHPGKLDDFVRLFEAQFVETQAEVGMTVAGIFRDLDDADRFVWIRGFQSMEARGKELPTFYGGPVWQAHRNTANPMMLDSDNVLLLHPVLGNGFALPPSPPAQKGAVLAGIHYLDDALLAPFQRFFEKQVANSFSQRGGEVIAAFCSETSPNNFPRLPVREKDRVFVWFSRFDSQARMDRFIAWLHGRKGWREGAPESLLPAFMRKPELIRLRPTLKSLIA